MRSTRNVDFEITRLARGAGSDKMRGQDEAEFIAVNSLPDIKAHKAIVVADPLQFKALARRLERLKQPHVLLKFRDRYLILLWGANIFLHHRQEHEIST